MGSKETRSGAKLIAAERNVKSFSYPSNEEGERLAVPDFFGIHLFEFEKADKIPSTIKEEVKEVTRSGKHLSREHAEVIADAVSEWAQRLGATHFCHWFQPLTGSTAEKHDAFLDIDKNKQPIIRLSASQLMQGEPDASSFPNGGGRSTFEARGYTAWDITSPIFIMESGNGKTLFIPTAFFSYTSEALDVKTPLLRSLTALDQKATKFLQLSGDTDVDHVYSTCGAEQEYFLVDKAFYFARPDLVMTGRTLFGAKTSRNQQLDDHYFGPIPERVQAFMQELEVELYKVGIAAKTRHNEVAPGQFELAPIFCHSNVAADQNQLMMSIMKKIAPRHDFVVLLHEKPFPGINGNGKHINWSLSDNKGRNLLNPGANPHENHRFLALTSIICEAVYRHSEILRVSISDAGNDHRLGANEAPPSIISVFIGETLEKIFDAIKEGATFEPNDETYLDIGTSQLAQLLKDNSDRNRTSPFAFTGDKFEFRAVGGSKSIGLPLSMLNSAVADVLDESNQFLEEKLNEGLGVEAALGELTRKWVISSYPVLFNGDGYSQEWVKEAASRGLPNHRTTAEALAALKNPKVISHLTRLGVLSEKEVAMRHNILVERYILLRSIEINCLGLLVHQHVLPSAFSYKKQLAELVSLQKDLGTVGEEKEILETLTKEIGALSNKIKSIDNAMAKGEKLEEQDFSSLIANEVMPLMEEAGAICEKIEYLTPDGLWTLPTAYDLLFVR